MKHLFFFLPILLSTIVFAQTTHKSFEIRYFTKDPAANGETDFKGETEWMDTEQRVRFLSDYANYASHFFGNPDFDEKVVSQNEVKDILANIKPQPLTAIRRTIPLNGWKVYGFRAGQDLAKHKALYKWESFEGASVINGMLVLENASLEWDTGSLSWRFNFKMSIAPEEKSTFNISLGDGQAEAIELNLTNGMLTIASAGESISEKLNNDGWTDIEAECDFTQKRFNLIVDGQMLSYYIPMADTTMTSVTKLSVHTKGKVRLDDLFLFNHLPVDDVRKPYSSKVIIDEDFELKPVVNGWQEINFDDEAWKETDLPSVHGGIAEEGESYYLRKKISTDEFERATLYIETLDPGGEIWINNQAVAVISDRHPVELDVTPYLMQNRENIIAVRVRPYKITNPMGHTPNDLNIGWFLGRAKLALTDDCMINDALIHTKSIGDPAEQSHKVLIHYKGKYYFPGRLEINYYPWFPEEGGKIASYNQEVQIRPNIVNEFNIKIPVYNYRAWSCEDPVLYKVEVILKDMDGRAVDDYVTTTGIRTVEQKNGDFYLNNEQAMLNGAQIMGFRIPVKTMAKINRCANPETVAEELLMIKKMGANLLRLHVHAQTDTTDGINDPRYAEMADQLGICLIWQTAAWIRAGEAWNIDFKGFPKYMQQVYNHPSVVMWEASNHPNRFKRHAISDSHDFVGKIYNLIYAADQSRIISPTSFWQHLHYGDYYGTIDYEGNKINAVPEYTAHRVTRGSQDSYAGYGHDWSVIRNLPNEWASSCLAAKEMAYFNFEHEESIGQPNWDLCKGKPWYLLQSYEWDYDEGSIGRKLTAGEWKASQAWQAFSAWESMKKQILVGYDGFSWCCLHGGPNMGTYKKPLIDNLGHPKLAFYINKMVFQKTWAGSSDVDVVYGPDDKITPVVNHLGENKKADVVICLESLEGKVIDREKIENITLEKGHTFTKLDAFSFKDVPDGTYVISYEVTEK